jgi:hypothetical protein
MIMQKTCDEIAMIIIHNNHVADGGDTVLMMVMLVFMSMMMLNDFDEGDRHVYQIIMSRFRGSTSQTSVFLK